MYKFLISNWVIEDVGFPLRLLATKIGIKQDVNETNKLECYLTPSHHYILYLHSIFFCDKDLNTMCESASFAN